MDIDAPLALLAGLSPARFMRRHWHKRPLHVRGAWPGLEPPLTRAALFELAGRDDVRSRLVQRSGDRWSMRQGPLPRRALPPLRLPGWTVLVQGVDLALPAAAAILEPFAFIPHARLDDLMVSWASDGAGVGPHLDSYDVFLLQLSGRRRWRIGRSVDPALVPGLPLKILRRFEPEHIWQSDPGDLLYLPPGWAHDGVAEGECMTASVGFRAPALGELARELLLRLADAAGDDERRYADGGQCAVTAPGRVPQALQTFAARAVAQSLARPGMVERVLGEWLTEPKAQVSFTRARARAGRPRPLRLDSGSRMAWDAHRLYLNGESFVPAPTDRAALRRLADSRRIDAAGHAALAGASRRWLRDAVTAGWLLEEDLDR